MERLPETPILKFHPDCLQNVRKQKNFDDPKKLNEAIDILQEWVRKQPHFTVKEFDRDFLERIIITNKGLLERSKIRLDKICTLRTLMPEYFRPINVTKDLSNLDVFNDAMLPKMTPDDYRIYLTQNTGKRYTSKMILDNFKRQLIYCQYALRHDYYAGIICIYDMSEANMMEFVTNLNVTVFRQMIAIVMEGYGAKVKAVYIISGSKIVSTLCDIIKSVVSKKLGDRLEVLNTIELLKEKVPVDILPRDYGGNEKSMAELNANCVKEITTDEFIEYMKKTSEMKTDESLRPAGKFNEEYLGMAGTFRTLTVD